MKSKPVSKVVKYLLVLFILANVGVTVYFLFPVFQSDLFPPPTPKNPPTRPALPTSTSVKNTLQAAIPAVKPTGTSENIAIPTFLPTQTPQPTSIPVTPTATAPGANYTGLQDQGVLILSLADGANFHLFAYNPQYLPLLRLTDGESDDVSPAVSPDGTRIAFSSHRNGAWDLYILDLRSGESIQVTHTPEYEGSPTWSPDGQWIAYEAYVKAGNLDIFLLDATHPENARLQLTEDPASDFSPSWIPGNGGRQIAFVSDRSGNADIWIARLDDFKERFVNISQDSDSVDTHPAWSPDGVYISWAKRNGGDSSLVVADPNNINVPLKIVGSGDWPVWGPNGVHMTSRVSQANLTALSTYDINTSQITIPLIRMPGPLEGMDWKAGELAQAIGARLADAPSPTAAPLWSPVLRQDPMPAGLDGLVSLDGVSAPAPLLLDSVDESYVALRSKIGELIGWDFMNSLAAAFMEKDQPGDPGAGTSWLSTGKAFKINDLPMNSGWMVLVREDIGTQIYWHIYLKTRSQDGSQGRPMTSRAWDINSRNSGDPTVYETGGKDIGVPQGYWVDFTEWAGRYGWDRFPALANWITYYPGARFDLFALSEGQDLNTALGQIYPGEVFTRQVVIPTLTPFPTPEVLNPTSTPVTSK